MAVAVTFPLVNPNEPEAILVGLHVIEGQAVDVGDLLCTVETTKNTSEIIAQGKGYLVGIRFKEGDTVQAGDILGYLADSIDWEPPLQTGIQEANANGIRITQPAMALAQQYDLDLDRLIRVQPPKVLLTESLVRSYLASLQAHKLDWIDESFDTTAIVIYGAGGHGKSILDMLRLLGGYRVVGFVDDGVPKGTLVMNVPVLGDRSVLLELHARGVRLAVNAVGGVGNLGIRDVVFERLKDAGFEFPTFVHPMAFLEASASLSPGVQVFPFAYVGSEVKVGFGSIINTGSIISHECVLGELVNISPGAILAGGVEIADCVLIGMGVTINLLVKVGTGVRVGHVGAIKEDIPEKRIVMAGGVWPK